MTFAGITVALVLGSIVDRMKFSFWIVFTILWVTFIYCPIAHWVWGGGWMGEMGALDFAGGNVVHINAGVAGLVLFSGPGQARRLRQRGHVSLQHRPHRPGRGPAVVRLVRIQRRQPAGRRRGGRIGIPGHQHLGRHGGPGVDVLRMDRHRQTHGIGHRFRRGCRTGGHHAGRRIRQPAGVTGDRPGFRIPGLLFRCRGQTQDRLRRLAGCIRRPWYVRYLGCSGHRAFRQSRHHRRGAGLFYGNPGQLWIQVVSIVATAALPRSGR
jgi:hypothetical protein